MGGGIFYDIIAGGAAAGGKGVGLGLAVYAAYKMIAFLMTFVAGRLDARQGVLDNQQARLDVSLGKRLEHLERTEEANRKELAANRAEITRLREFLEILATELRQRDPTNPKLLEVSRSLRAAWAAPLQTPDDMNDALRRME